MQRVLILAALVAIALGTATISLSMARSPLHPNLVFGHENPAMMRDAVARYINTKYSKYLKAGVKNVKMGGNINPLGIFYVNVTIGNPPQKVAVAVDSGSYTFLVPGPKCNGCPTAPLKYDFTKSSTAKAVDCDDTCSQCTNSGQCSFSNTYETCNLTDTTQPCTISGPVYTDYFALGPLKSKGSTKFGVITYQTLNFQQLFVIDGIIGFAMGTTFGQIAQIFQLANEGQITNKFSMCFDSKSQQGGVLTLGQPDPNLYLGNFQTTPLLNSELYVITMTDIKLGGVSIGLPSYTYTNNEMGGCVVDSGTNILLVPNSIFTGIQQTLASFCNKRKLVGICNVKQGASLFDGKCFKMASKDVSAYPPLVLYYGSATMILKPEQYLLPSQGDLNTRCLGIQNSGHGGILIIGDTTMEGYYTVFDVDNNQLKWATVNKQNCRG